MAFNFNREDPTTDVVGEGEEEEDEVEQEEEESGPIDIGSDDDE